MSAPVGQQYPFAWLIARRATVRCREASADSGYLSEANLQTLADRHISAYVAIGRAKHAAEGKRTMTGALTKALRAKLKRAGSRSRYRFRKQIVEPAFGQIKQARGFRQFLLRGIEKVTAEWALICTTRKSRLSKLSFINKPDTSATWTGSWSRRIQYSRKPTKRRK
ncbi:transposase [Bradyrhizobium sp. Pear77]|nr:transposase [Bradyrhizobium altum]MCC8966726.1 transposase [Bradyrhizobium oropedii]